MPPRIGDAAPATAAAEAPGPGTPVAPASVPTEGLAAGAAASPPVDGPPPPARPSSEAPAQTVAFGPRRPVAPRFRPGRHDPLPQVLLPLSPQAQVRNSCGTTSLAMVLDQLASSGTGAPTRGITTREIDLEIRSRLPATFATPSSLAGFAEDRGFVTSVRTRASTDDLRQVLSQGLPVIVLIDAARDYPPADPAQADTVSPRARSGSPHYIVLTGFKTGPDGQVTDWYFRDPSVGQDNPHWSPAAPTQFHGILSDATLRWRWDNVPMAGMDVGYDRVMIAVAPSPAYALPEPAPPPALSEAVGNMLQAGARAIEPVARLVSPSDG